MPESSGERRFRVVDFDQVPPVPCPCGSARRALTDVAELPLTVHETQISADARVHYHRRLTELYYILECGPNAHMELDGEVVPVDVGRLIMIPPGVRHRAIGPMKVLLVVSPKFDASDECFDD